MSGCLRLLTTLILVLGSPLLYAITGNSCTVNVTGTVGSALTAPSSCSTISVFLNPDINFVSGLPMPPGLFITKSSGSGGNATWQISGNPSEAGSGTGSYSFTDSNPGAVTMTVNFNISGPVLPSAVFGPGTVGRPYSAVNLSASGGSGAGYSFAVTDGALPPGLNLGAGTIAGTPTTAGTYAFTITATDGASASGAASFSILIHPPVSMTPTASISRTIGQSFASNFAASGGAPPVVYTLSAGSLPGGANLNPASGALTGTAANAESGSLGITATDNFGSFATTVVAFNISPLPAISLSTPAGTVGALYTQALGFTGAVSTAVLSSGTLPSGLSLVGGTTISGTPTLAGLYSFTLSATDTNGVLASGAFSIEILPAISFTTSTLPSANSGAPYLATILATGGNSTILYTLAGGSLPPGLQLSNNGTLSGSPTQAGHFQFIVQAADSHGNSANRSFSISVLSPLSIEVNLPLPQATVGSRLEISFGVNGGTAPFNWSVSGSLPPGLQLVNGVLSGVPAAAGDSTFAVQVADNFGSTASRLLSLIVNPQLQILNSNLGGPYSQDRGINWQMQWAGGTWPFHWTVASGTLPPGLALSPAGRLTGSFRTNGTYSFELRVSDGAGAQASRRYLLGVGAGPQFVSPVLAEATALHPYRRQVEVLSALPIREWRVGTGAIGFPPGLQFEQGELHGVPAQAGNYDFELNVEDVSGAAAGLRFLFRVNPYPELLPLKTAIGYRPGQTFRWQIPAQGGSPPLRFALLSGYPPPGMQLNPMTGEVQGTSQSKAEHGFTIEVTDANGASARRHYVIAPEAPAGQLELDLSAMPTTLTLGVEVHGQVQVSGGHAPYTLRPVSGRLPAGLRWQGLNIFGQPEESGEFSVSLEAGDSQGQTQSGIWRFTVKSASWRVEPSLLRFTSVEDSLRSVPHQLRVAGPAGPGTVQSSAAWLKVSRNELNLPAVLEVRVDSSALPVGHHLAELRIESQGQLLKVPLEVDQLPADPSEWSVEFAETPGGGFLALLQGHAAQISYEAHLSPASSAHFVLDRGRGEILAPESSPISIAPRSTSAPGHLDLSVHNLSSAEHRSFTRQRKDPERYEANVRSVLLYADPEANFSSRSNVVVRSNSRLKFRLAALPEASWIEVQALSTLAATEALIEVRAKTTGMSVGTYQTMVRLYDDTGGEILQLPVTLHIGAFKPSLAIVNHSISLPPGQAPTSFRLRNPSSTTTSYRIHTPMLQVKPRQGILLPGAETEIQVSAGETPTPAWSREKVLVEWGEAELDLVEVDLSVSLVQNRCPLQSPILGVQSPGAVFTAETGKPAELQFTVRNPCGEMIRGGIMALRIPGQEPVSLYQAPDGFWYGQWLPETASASLHVEVIWLDVQQGLSLSRWLSGQIKLSSP